MCQAGIVTVELWQHDFRDAELPRESYDVIPKLTKSLKVYALDIPDDYGYIEALDAYSQSAGSQAT